MNALSARLIDVWDAALRRYYTWRYGPVARRLDRPPDDAEPGFVVVQIDGLSHAHLLDAAAQGYAPFIAARLRAGEGEACRWYTGLPSTTPAMQAAIMFGRNDHVPGFRWYRKRTRTPVVCKSPAFLHRLQEEVSQGRPGILEGGASYGNMFDGGASISLFTLSAIGRTSLLEKVGGLALFLVLLFSPVRVLRILLLSGWTYLSTLWRRLAAVFRPSKYGRLGLLSPFYHVLTDVIMREVETFAILVDLYRGVPAVFANYMSYDYWAHIFGPDDPSAYAAVRAIDDQIRQIERMARRGGRRYDLFVLSDHGLAPSVPFEVAFGAPLARFVAEAAGRPVRTDDAAPSRRDSPAATSLRHELATAEERLAGVPHEAAFRLRRSLQEREEPEPGEVHAAADIVVRNSGPLSHVYFTFVEAPLTGDEIEAVYPGLMRRLADHPGIAAVAARGEGPPLLVTPQGSFPCRAAAAAAAFPGTADAEAAVQAIARLLDIEESGDLVVLGRWGMGGTADLTVTFERQLGTHGGLGGEQCYPFLATLGRPTFEIDRLAGPESLYRYFLQYSRRRREAAGAPEPARRGDTATIAPS